MKENKKSMFKKIFSLKTLIIVLVVIVLAGGYAGTYYFYHKYQNVKKNPEAVMQDESNRLIAQVGQLMMLPTDETPTVATVLDKEKVKDQAFFKNSENGDKLLTYAKALEAILYRPSANKIVAVGPIYNSDQTTASSQPVKIAYYNGTGTTGATTAIEKKINDKFTTAVTTASKDNAAKTDYQGITVVDINGSLADGAKTIADFLGGKVGTLPAGEAKPNADILIILGK
jgi:hypothetical protein